LPEPDDNYESTLEVTISRDMGTLIRVAAEQRGPNLRDSRAARVRALAGASAESWEEHA